MDKQDLKNNAKPYKICDLQVASKKEFRVKIVMCKQSRKEECGTSRWNIGTTCTEGSS